MSVLRELESQEMGQYLRRQRALRAGGLAVALAGVTMIPAATMAVAEDSGTSTKPGITALDPAAGPTITTPLNGSTITEPWLHFSGQGEPGATVKATINGTVVAEGEVIDLGELGAIWDLDVAPEDVPQGQLFDATVTHTAADGTVLEAVIEDLTYTFTPTTISGPDTMDPRDDSFRGDAVHGDSTTIAILLEGTLASGEEVRKAAFSQPTDIDWDADSWGGTWEISHVDDAGRNWRFIPDELLEDGNYVATSAVIDDAGQVTNGEQIEFVVGDGGAEDGSEAGAESGAENGSDDGAESGTDNGTDQGAESGAENGSDDGAEAGSDDGAEAGSDDGAEAGSDDGAEAGSDDGAEAGSDDGAESGTDNGTDQGAESGAENGSDDGAEVGSDDGADDGAQAGSDNGAEAGSDNGAESGAEAGSDNGADDQLPDTGSSELGLALSGLVLLLAGGAGIIVRRRVTA
jgi:LPXTG-motif cell wall-anchored protein